MFRHPQALVDPKNPRWPPLSKIILAVGGTAIFFPIAPRIKKIGYTMVFRHGKSNETIFRHP